MSEQKDMQLGPRFRQRTGSVADMVRPGLSICPSIGVGRGLRLLQPSSKAKVFRLRHAGFGFPTMALQPPVVSVLPDSPIQSP